MHKNLTPSILLTLYKNLQGLWSWVCPVLRSVVGVRKMDEWDIIAKKRILNILDKRRISYSSHLEIKIAESGPSYMRPEPHKISKGVRLLKADNLIKEYDLYKHFGKKSDGTKFLVLDGFGSPQDIARAKAFYDWRQMFLKMSQISEYCGFVLEKLIYDAVLTSNKYHVIGSGPEYQSKKLIKTNNSEILSYQGKNIYKHKDGAGFDLFCIHKESNIPIGIEAKNIREWIYPASEEVWRAIARACTLDCLPVLIARRIPFITKAGFFSKFGILGFESNFQFFDNEVQAKSDYKFKEKVIHKDYLGFSDIKLIKEKDETPKSLVYFFEDVLDNEVKTYYKRFLKYKDILGKYAIDYGMANNMPQRKRLNLYKEFKEEVGYNDIENPCPEILIE